MAQYKVFNFGNEVGIQGSDASYTRHILGGVGTMHSATDFATLWSNYQFKIHDFLNDCDVFMPELLKIEKEMLLKINKSQYKSQNLNEDLTEIKDKIRNWMNDHDIVTSTFCLFHKTLRSNKQDGDHFSREIKVYERANKVYQIMNTHVLQLEKLEHLSPKDKVNLCKKYLSNLIEALEHLVPGQSSGRSWN